MVGPNKVRELLETMLWLLECSENLTIEIPSKENLNTSENLHG
jgi:hypothetical protein